MITIHVTGRDGETASHQVSTGDPLMFALRDELALPVEGACGGSATCGTCHIKLATDWAQRLESPQDYELAMLDMILHRDEAVSRLACQITVTAALDGLQLTLVPEE